MTTINRCHGSTWLGGQICKRHKNGEQAVVTHIIFVYSIVIANAERQPTQLTEIFTLTEDKEQMKISDPFKILTPNERWAPTQSQMDIFQNDYEKLLPPLVYKICLAVTKWRDDGYQGASDTSKSLMDFWFNHEHLIGQSKFSFFFSQREAIESIIYLYEVAKARDKYELMRFDSSERVSTGMFDETWTRYVVKMATGTGKTKVMGLTLVWSYFHKLYETDSKLSNNFLVIAPNIIVLNRLRKDFDGLKMFFEEPFIPENGFDGKDWKNDFQLTLHIQDNLKPITESGNIFLTNIHRVFFNEDPEQSFETTFLGVKPKPDADTSKGLDLGKILRSDKIKELLVLNDEAHHIHDKNLAWFKSIEDISNKLKLKTGSGISLQADFSATPKHNKGAIFVQTICDYPLVEAIKQNVVKSPVLPDEASRQKIQGKDSNDFVERYRDFIHLGYLEWEQQYEELKNYKTPILFIMTMSTKEADQAAAFLEKEYPLMKNAVLTIHTNNSGEIKESAASKRDKDELEKLRKAADDIDKDLSPYKAVVSVLMLREGWDVKNVTTVVGLRPFGADSKILPEQTIGRGLRPVVPVDELPGTVEADRLGQLVGAARVLRHPVVVVADGIIAGAAEHPGEQDGQRLLVGRRGLVAGDPLLGHQVRIGARVAGRPVLVVHVDHQLVLRRLARERAHTLDSEGKGRPDGQGVAALENRNGRARWRKKSTIFCLPDT